MYHDRIYFLFDQLDNLLNVIFALFKNWKHIVSIERDQSRQKLCPFYHLIFVCLLTQII